MTNSKIYFHHAGLTDTGILRDHNEDAYKLPADTDGHTLARKGYLYVLADGMGGHQKGEVASAVTIEAVGIEYYASVPSLEGEHPEDDIIDALTHAIEEANAKVTQATEGGGTTVVAAVLHQDRLVAMNVGDSRAYLLRDGELRPISRDHSLVSRLVEMGKITEEEALTHPRRNVLYQALGQGPDLEIFIVSDQVQVGDLIVLCSDGLWGELGESAMQDVLESDLSPLEKIEHMVDLANASGGPDNITAIVIQVSDEAPADPNIGSPSFPPLPLAESMYALPKYVKPNSLPEGKHFTD